ncbi:MAG: hypothetical protein ACOYVD_09455 [Bacillota bacterium]
MKAIKLIGIGLSTLIVSFFLVFFSLEVYKHTSAGDLFRAHKPYDLIIKNGRIIDGTGGEIYKAEIGIRGDAIAAIGKNLVSEGAVIFNAEGYTIAPQKVEWPEKLDWIERDLASALLKYPSHRIIVKKAANGEWIGKSVKGLLLNNIFTQEVLGADPSAMAVITPRLDEPAVNNLASAYYRLTGWRSDLLEIRQGKIEKDYEAQLIVFNHREIDDETLLNILNQEKLPPYEYLIKGSAIQSINTNS